MGANEKLRSSRSLESLTPPVHNYDVVVSALTGEVASHGRRAVLLLESNMFATMGYTKSYYYCLFILLFFKNSILPVRPAVGTRRFPHASSGESGSMSQIPRLLPVPKTPPACMAGKTPLPSPFYQRCIQMDPSHVAPSSFPSVAPFPFSMAVVRRAK